MCVYVSVVCVCGCVCVCMCACDVWLRYVWARHCVSVCVCVWARACLCLCQWIEYAYCIYAILICMRAYVCLGVCSYVCLFMCVMCVFALQLYTICMTYLHQCVWVCVCARTSYQKNTKVCIILGHTLMLVCYPLRITDAHGRIELFTLYTGMHMESMDPTCMLGNSSFFWRSIIACMEPNTLCHCL